jgi:two-component system, NarL family, invasion response regulator UvrY
MKILIADDHEIIRHGVRQVLADGFKEIEFGEASNAREAVAQALQHSWDLVVLDIAMPGRNGLDVLKELRSQRPHLPVLVLSMYPEKQYALRALRSGAAGYLTKAGAVSELVVAVKKILAGGKFVSATLAEQLADELSTPKQQLPHDTLSDRELEILCSIASGKTVKEIADELALSVNTISTYRARLLEKMKMRTSAELMHYAISNGLVQ